MKTESNTESNSLSNHCNHISYFRHLHIRACLATRNVDAFATQRTGLAFVPPLITRIAHGIVEMPSRTRPISRCPASTIHTTSTILNKTRIDNKASKFAKISRLEWSTRYKSLLCTSIRVSGRPGPRRIETEGSKKNISDGIRIRSS